MQICTEKSECDLNIHGLGVPLDVGLGCKPKSVRFSSVACIILGVFLPSRY